MTDVPKRIWAIIGYRRKITKTVVVRGEFGNTPDFNHGETHEYHHADLSDDLVRAALTSLKMKLFTEGAQHKWLAVAADMENDPEIIAEIIATVTNKE